MNQYTAATYGDHIAEIYDELYAGMFDEEAQVALLAELAGAGRALELGIGTGRLAIPLAERGIAVHGVDASAAMVARLRAKPGGEAIPVVIGDFADVPVEGRFALIYIVFNTFFALLTQEDQVRCFQNVATHLDDAGVFLIEAFVPDPTRFVRDQNVQTSRVGIGRVVIDATRHDPVFQRVFTQHIHITETGIRLYPVHLRYAWPSELDLMARLAGLRLRARWGGWRGEPFTAASTTHVSVYERA